MSKTILGATPKHFAPTTVKFTKPDGEEAEVIVTYKYRTRTAFGQFLDAAYKDAGMAKPSADRVDLKELFEKSRDKSADQLLDCIVSWDLDDKLTRENLQVLADELPAAAIALIAGYSACCTEGRVKN